MSAVQSVGRSTGLVSGVGSSKADDLDGALDLDANVSALESDYAAPASGYGETSAFGEGTDIGALTDVSGLVQELSMYSPEAYGAAESDEPLPANLVAASRRPSHRDYMVRPGDTLAKIARKLGVSVDDLLRANPQLTNSNEWLSMLLQALEQRRQFGDDQSLVSPGSPVSAPPPPPPPQAGGARGGGSVAAAAAPAPSGPVKVPRGMEKAPADAKGKLEWAKKLAVKMGLSITSTTGGNHAAGSYHYQGRAIDVAGPPQKMAAFFDAIKQGTSNGTQVTELFYDPKGGIDNGKPCRAIGGHRDHVHVAF